MSGTARRRSRRVRQQARKEMRELVTVGDHEPCSCGGRFFFRLNSLGVEFSHTQPPCRQFEAVDDGAQLVAFILIQRRAVLVHQTHTVPWFPEMQAEMPGYIVQTLLALTVISHDLGAAHIDRYVAALCAAFEVDRETALDIIALGVELGVIGGDELPPGTTVTAGASGLN